MIGKERLKNLEQPKRKSEFNISYLYELPEMVKFKEIYEDFEWKTDYENEEIELIDYYCKNDDCECTKIRFGIEKESEEIGAILYDYKSGEVKGISDSKYSPILLSLDESERILINTILANRHQIVKLEFKQFKLKTELELNKRQIQGHLIENSTKRKKRGRNELCYCGSGKKFKKCCFNKE